LEEELHTPAYPGVYYSILLTNPVASVKTCAACRLFHNVVHGGITLSEPTTLRVCLQEKRDLLEVEDVGKVEKERGRAAKVDETPNLDGKGQVWIFADHGMHLCLDIVKLVLLLKGLPSHRCFPCGALANQDLMNPLHLSEECSLNAMRIIRRAN
jgi:hypothetical protein